MRVELRASTRLLHTEVRPVSLFRETKRRRVDDIPAGSIDHQFRRFCQGPWRCSRWRALLPTTCCSDHYVLRQSKAIYRSLATDAERTIFSGFHLQTAVSRQFRSLTWHLQTVPFYTTDMFCYDRTYVTVNLYQLLCYRRNYDSQSTHLATYMTSIIAVSGRFFRFRFTG